MAAKNDTFNKAAEVGMGVVNAMVDIVPVMKPVFEVAKGAFKVCNNAVAHMSASQKFEERLKEAEVLIQSMSTASEQSEKIKDYENELRKAMNNAQEELKNVGSVFHMFSNGKKTADLYKKHDSIIVNIMVEAKKALNLENVQITAQEYEIFDVEKFIITNNGVEALLRNEEKLHELATKLGFSVEVVRTELANQSRRIDGQVAVFAKDLGEELKKVQEALNSSEVDFPEIDMKVLDYKTKHVLGEGKFGRIYRGTYMDKVVAVKTFKNVASQLSPDMIKELKKEVKTLFILGKYPGFVRLIGANLDLSKGEPCLALELAEGTLHDVLHTDKLPIDLSFAVKAGIAVDIARGLHILHQLNIFYRDLNTHNVLIFFEGKERRVVAKLTNFGLAKGATEHASVGAKKGIVKSATAYGAPELFGNITSSGVPYSCASDVYALGIALNELMTEDIPFKDFDGNDMKLMDHIKAGNQPTLFQSSIHDLPAHRAIHEIIKVCLSQRPENRPHMPVIVDDLQRVCAAGLDIAMNGQSSEFFHKDFDLLCVTAKEVNTNGLSAMALADKVPLESLSDEDCVKLLSSLGCEVVVPTKGLSEWLYVVAAEENDEDRETGLREFGEWSKDVCLKEVSSKLRSMHKQGVDQGSFALAKEMRDSQGKDASS